MEQLLLPILLTVVGGGALLRNASYLRDEAKLRAYLATSPKAGWWVKKWGMEKMVVLSRRVFLPLGIVVSLILLFAGLRALSFHAF